MSTKSTKQYDEDNFHLYEDVMDGFAEDDPRLSGRLWLDLDGAEFSVKTLTNGKVRVTVELIAEVLDGLRKELVPADDVYEKLGLLEETAAHMLWCLENKLADQQGAVYAMKKLIPRDALRRYNRRWGGK